MGELLKQFDGRGDHMKKGVTPLSRGDVAERAGISADQQKQAVRVANIPAEKFEAAMPHHLTEGNFRRAGHADPVQLEQRLLSELSTFRLSARSIPIVANSIGPRSSAASINIWIASRHSGVLRSDWGSFRI